MSTPMLYTNQTRWFIIHRMYVWDKYKPNQNTNQTNNSHKLSIWYDVCLAFVYFLFLFSFFFITLLLFEYPVHFVCLYTNIFLKYILAMLIFPIFCSLFNVVCWLFNLFFFNLFDYKCIKCIFLRHFVLLLVISFHFSTILFFSVHFHYKN